YRIMSLETYCTCYVGSSLGVEYQFPSIKHFSNIHSCVQDILHMKDVNIQLFIPADMTIIEIVKELLTQVHISIVMVYILNRKNEFLWQQFDDISHQLSKFHKPFAYQTLKAFLITLTGTNINTQSDNHPLDKHALLRCLTELHQDVRKKREQLLMNKSSQSFENITNTTDNVLIATQLSSFYETDSCQSPPPQLGKCHSEEEEEEKNV
ncbi:unnamed protein product, partial [Didymodactylos carnosus]